MGLLEKAYEYKKEINRKGGETLIDTIEGPAETEMLDDDINVQTEYDDVQNTEFGEDDNQENEDLFQLPEDDEYSPLDTLNEQKTKFNTEIDIPENENNFRKTELNEPSSTSGSSSNPLTSEDAPIIPANIDDTYSNTEDDNMTENMNSNMDADDSAVKKIEPDNEQEESTDDTGYDEIKSRENSGSATGIDPETEGNIHDNSEISADSGSAEENIVKDCRTQYEIKKEISRSETKKTLFEVVIFSVMGQIVTSSVLILVKDPDRKWTIANSSKQKSSDKPLILDSNSGIMKYLKKDIIDIENYKNDSECRDQYNDLNSLNARLLFPWTYKNETLGIIALGNKITDDDYTDDEREVIQSICDAAAIEFKKLDTIEILKKDIENAQINLSFAKHLNSIKEKIYLSNNLKDIHNIIKPELDEIGITGYSVFAKELDKDKYISIISGDESVLEENEKKYIIDESNPFISFVKSRRSAPRIEDYDRSDIIKKVFTEIQINKMSILWVYPFEIGNILIGFITIFKVKENLLDQENISVIDERIGRLSATLLSAIFNIMTTDPDRNRYIDYTGSVFLRINKELENSKNLNIPITLIVFSVKNFKRYENMFGFFKSEELINKFSQLIVSRLSETDFSARYDRNKIIVLLPGKDRKFGTTLANTVRIEFMQKFKKDEMQLLITYLISESPTDATDFNSFTDNID